MDDAVGNLRKRGVSLGCLMLRISTNDGFLGASWDWPRGLMSYVARNSWPSSGQIAECRFRFHRIWSICRRSWGCTAIVPTWYIGIYLLQIAMTNRFQPIFQCQFFAFFCNCCFLEIWCQHPSLKLLVANADQWWCWWFQIRDHRLSFEKDVLIW